MRSWIERHQVLAVALMAAGLFVVWQLRDVFVVLFLGYILAAALRPVVDWLDRTLAVPRVLAILLIYAAFVAAVVVVVAPALGPIGAQGQQFADRLGQLTQSWGQTLPFVGPAQVSDVVQYLQAQLPTAAAGSIAFVVGAVSAIIISIYLLYDWHELHARLHEPSDERRARRAFGAFVRESEAALGAWVRGQLLLSSAVAVAVFVTLILLGVQFAPMLAVLAWFCELIPYAGPFVAATPAALVALSQSTGQALGVVIAYIVIQQLEGHVLVPLVMRRAVDLHPVVIIAVMLAGFEVMGIPGVLLAVPVAVMARLALKHFWYA